MASTSPDQNSQNPPLVQRLLEAWQPRFPGATPPERETRSSSDILPIPEDDIVVQSDGGGGGSSSIELLSETDAATWLTTHVRSTEDIMFSRIPAWGVEGVTTCIFPKVVALRWPSTVFEAIGKAETSCLRIKNVRGKGQGCMAARAVPRGELVARERALLVMPRTCLSPQQLVSAATNTMMPNQRAAFFALHNCNSADPNDALSIISTNSFLIPGVPGHNVLYSAVFETFSRLNHRCRIPSSFGGVCPGTNKRRAASCCPNAIFRWDRSTFSGEIRALRPISTGEEVTISYFQGILEPAAVTHERQKFLLECYNFKCACPVCGRPSKVCNRSDEERPIISVSVTDIGKYYREMAEDWIIDGGDRARLPNFLHAVEEALDREMIFCPTYWIYLARAIVTARCAIGEARAARKWAVRAAQHMRAATGSDGGWDAIAKEPEKCEWWRAWDRPRIQGSEE